MPKVEFIHANILDVDFRQFDAFYFYNSFYENILPQDKIDDTVLLDRRLYKKYSEYVKNQLDLMPKGTRLATYYNAFDEIPKSYKIVSKDERQKFTSCKKI